MASCEVICGTTPVLLCTTKNYNVLLQRITPYYNLLLQDYSVLPSTTPVLLCTTKNYNVLLQRITPYYNLLLQDYSVLPSTPPVLLCTTKYYASTTCTTPVLVLLCTTKYYASTTMYRDPGARSKGMIRWTGGGRASCSGWAVDEPWTGWSCRNSMGGG